MTRGCPSLMLVIAVVALAACQPQKACVSGATQPCTCVNGRQGAQTCDSAGQSWGTCVCQTVDAQLDQTLVQFRDARPDHTADRAIPDLFKPDGCTPKCTLKQCGPDGCGGTCPPGCSTGTICMGLLCVPPSLSFDLAVSPFGPSLPAKWAYVANTSGTTVSCIVVGTELRIKASNGTSSFQIESAKFNPATCSLHQVTDFSAALLKPTSIDPWGFLPPLQPAGLGQYALNFDLDCKVTDGVLSGTFFFTVLYHGNTVGPYVNITNGSVICTLN